MAARYEDSQFLLAIAHFLNMTEENQPNNPEEEEFDPVTDPRDWSAAETELACFALARRKGKRLVKIINTKKPRMPIIPAGGYRVGLALASAFLQSLPCTVKCRFLHVREIVDQPLS